jgi:hypothetical protein
VQRKPKYAVTMALVAGLVLAGCGGPSYLTVKGSVSSEVLAMNAPTGGVGNCILDLPSDGNQMTISADGVQVANAQLGNSDHQHKTSLGETCSVTFTFTNVPAGKQKYAITVNASNGNGLGGTEGCSGTEYYTQAQLAKPISLSCS